MRIWITAPFQDFYLEELKKDNEVCYENWFDTGIIREGKGLAIISFAYLSSASRCFSLSST